MPDEYQIALDPSLHLSPADFLAAWNASPQARAAGQLRPDSAMPQSYLPPEAVTLLLQTAVTIASTVLAQLIYDLLKEKYYPQKPKIITINQGDGRPTLVVTIGIANRQSHDPHHHLPNRPIPKQPLSRGRAIRQRPAPPISVSDPFSAAEEERLQWYFEEWLSFPFTGQVKAAEAAASVQMYGEALFEQVFQDRRVYSQYDKALGQHGFSTLVFEIRGTSAFHALHWEALKDPAQGHPFAVECAFYRQNDIPRRADYQIKPSPTLNVLLVTARP